MTILTAEIRDRLRDLVGEKGWIDKAADMAPYLTDWRGLATGRAAVVLRPETTAQVGEVVALCSRNGIGIVPQGGNTGLVAGAVPSPAGDQVVINLGRMNRIREIDPLDYTVVVEAGCILADLQTAAKAADRVFPLSLGAEGSCQIGGNLATNAGGVMTLRYGNMRDLVLGLEVVLPDGRIWNGLRRLRKNNTGYDLKHLFIAAEGTLGIITAAVLKLFPLPQQTAIALMAVPSPQASVALLAALRPRTGDAITAFELVPRLALDLAGRYVPDVTDPFDKPHPWYVLIEIDAGGERGDIRQMTEEALAAAIEKGFVLDAVVAQNVAQGQKFWRMRESLAEVQKEAGGSIRHDISVPVSRVPQFLEEATAAVLKAIPDARPFPFGHVGDGNIHFNILKPIGMEPKSFQARTTEINTIVHDILLAMGGSISAEHGIGAVRRAELERTADPLELELMQRVKAALDPDGIMNPGKLLG
ncbi:FAD-binding oxidoreductase [Dongia soli]|uniref:FAD-binding oxidoreductase n=1 Tax=Dongia soli TaxID=600628 RepID=A0ABU5EEE3_9PROT|nr:FAD-binding oxidoreductase [Dongia soli]MDY0884445.1 FAD-binding oxidoreductase [Dongia soli]